MSIVANLPARAGVGFKPVHFRDILAAAQPIGFFEVHAENYMGAGGPPHAQLGALRERYALSVHGVGLSIGSMQPLDREHLARLKKLCDLYQPESFSEHLAWSSHGEVYFNDLLPLPYTRQTLARVADVIEATTAVRYSQTQTWTILRERLGWTRQRPARRATERNEEAIANWVAQDWPRIKKAPGAGAPG